MIIKKVVDDSITMPNGASKVSERGDVMTEVSKIQPIKLRKFEKIKPLKQGDDGYDYLKDHKKRHGIGE